MGLWDTVKRGAIAFGTGGLSELGGARPVVDAAAGNDYVKNLMFGGNATKGIDAQPGHYDQATGQLGQIAQGAAGRAAPTAQTPQLGAPWQMQAAQLAPGQMDQSRGGLMGVANRLGSVAAGAAPGAGELAVNRQVGQATAAQTAAARMARGAGAALAYRNAARNTADIGLAGAGQAAQAQMADQQAANAQLGSIYGGMYGQDANVAGQNAQLAQAASSQNAQLGQQAMIEQARMGQTTALANLQAQLAQTGMNDQQQMAALGQMLGWDQAKIQAELQKAAIAAGDKGIFPQLLSMGGQIGAAYATGGMSAAVPKPVAAGGGNPYGWGP